MSNKVIVAKLDALASLIKRSSEIAEIANVSLDELHASIVELFTTLVSFTEQ